MGLAWTSMGGNALYIEAAMVESGEGKGGIRTTGAPGSGPGSRLRSDRVVLQESCICTLSPNSNHETDCSSKPSQTSIPADCSGPPPYRLPMCPADHHGYSTIFP